MPEIKGHITISRTSGTRRGDDVRICIEDHNAGVVACEVKMTLENFAKAITNQGFIDCVVEFNDSGKVGTQRENKTELVPVPEKRSYDNREGWQEKSLAPFLVDGWYPRSGDINNHHRQRRDENGNTFQEVVFFRNVPKQKRLDPDANVVDAEFPEVEEKA